jgi:hypothetical protein
VRFRVEQHFAAIAVGVREQRDQIRHRAARHNHPGFLSGGGRGHFLETADGGVAIAAVVTEFGAPHGVAHLFCRQRAGIGTEIDHYRVTRRHKRRKTAVSSLAGMEHCMLAAKFHAFAIHRALSPAFAN